MTSAIYRGGKALNQTKKKHGRKARNQTKIFSHGLTEMIQLLKQLLYFAATCTSWHPPPISRSGLAAPSRREQLADEGDVRGLPETEISE